MVHWSHVGLEFEVFEIIDMWTIKNINNQNRSYTDTRLISPYITICKLLILIGGKTCFNVR